MSVKSGGKVHANADLLCEYYLEEESEEKGTNVKKKMKTETL